MRSKRMTRTGAFLSARAAARPTNPPPTITTCGCVLCVWDSNASFITFLPYRCRLIVGRRETLQAWDSPAPSVGAGHHPSRAPPQRSCRVASLFLLALRLWSAPLHVGQVPAAPKGLIEADIGQEPGGADLCELVLGRIRRQGSPHASVQASSSSLVSADYSPGLLRMMPPSAKTVVAVM